jgi:predicted unusual protein kinase regulating ubiquinone biosynthesis (AarF/ABC1/UbiB family)
MKSLVPGNEINKLSTSKLARAAITGVAAAKVATTLAVHNTKKSLNTKELSESEKLKNEQEIGRILFTALGQLRGTALKVSQMLSTEVDLLPEGVRVELAKSCYQAPPLNRALINKVFIKEFAQAPSEVFAKFNSTAFAAASLGQVHQAITPCGETVAVKIQYPAIAASIHSDMRMIRAILESISIGSKLLPKKHIINDVLTEIELRLEEEVDYLKEAENTRWFKEKLLAYDIQVPKVFSQYSQRKVITSEFLPGLHLDEWLATNPSQVQRDDFGQRIYNAFIGCAFEMGALHADPHPGNYLFMTDGALAMLDFGCIKKFDKQFAKDKKALLNAYLLKKSENRAQRILAVYQAQGIIEASLELAEFKEKLLPLLEPVFEWVCCPFKNHEFDFSRYPTPPKFILDDAKKANQYLKAVPQNQLYFDRAMFGVFSLLRKMQAKVVTENQWIFSGTEDDQ